MSDSDSAPFASMSGFGSAFGAAALGLDSGSSAAMSPIAAPDADADPIVPASLPFPVDDLPPLQGSSAVLPPLSAPPSAPPSSSPTPSSSGRRIRVARARPSSNTNASSNSGLNGPAIAILPSSPPAAEPIPESPPAQNQTEMAPLSTAQPAPAPAVASDSVSPPPADVASSSPVPDNSSSAASVQASSLPSSILHSNPNPPTRGILKLKPALKKPAVPNPPVAQPPVASQPDASSGPAGSLKQRLSMIAKKIVRKGSDASFDHPGSSIVPGSGPGAPTRKSRRVGSQPLFPSDGASMADFMTPVQAAGSSAVTGIADDGIGAAPGASSGAFSEDEKSAPVSSDDESDSASESEEENMQLNEDLLEALAEFASVQPAGKGKKNKVPTDRRAQLLSRAFTIASKGNAIVPANAPSPRHMDRPEMNRDSSLPSTDSLSDAAGLPISPNQSFPQSNSQSQSIQPSLSRNPMIRKSSNPSNETRRFSTKRQFTMTTTQSNGDPNASEANSTVSPAGSSMTPIVPLHRRQPSLSKTKSRRSLSKSHTLKRSGSLRNINARGSAIYLSQEIRERSLFLFWPTNPIRAFCIKLASNHWYSGFNLVAIFFNCIVLSMESGRNIPHGIYGFDTLDAALNSFELIFAIIFTFEFLVKVIAGGFVFAGPTSYLQSNWNRLDFIVVILAILSFVPGFDNFTYLRSLRLFRPLKAASNVPGLRVMMSAMVASTMALGNVFLFVFLLLFTFALLGLQFSKDSYHNRCFPLSTGYQDPLTVYGFVSCAQNAGDIWGFSPRECPTGQFCADVGYNPYGGAMGYDNIVMAWVMSFIVMSGEGWSDIMYMAEDAISPATLWYYLALTALSNYLAGELVVAVMSVRFEDAKDKEKEKLREEREQAQALKQASKAIQALQKKHRLSSHTSSFDPAILGKTSSIIQLANVIKERNRRQSSIMRFPTKGARSSVERNPLSEVSPFHKTFFPPTLHSHKSANPVNPLSHGQSQFFESEQGRPSSPGLTDASQAEGSEGGQSKGGVSENSLSRRNSRSELSRGSDNSEAMPTQLKILSTQSTRAESIWRRIWIRIRIFCHRLVFNPYAVRLGSILTTFNCLILGMYYWGMDDTFRTTLDDINLALTIAFGVEFLLRFIALGWLYFRYGYFVLDLIVIIVAIFELSFPDTSRLQALRAFRVFRMFTVFRDWQAMRSLMKQVHRSLEDLFYFSLVLILFIFLFAQIGVSIAAGRLNFPPPQGLARDNMDNLGWAAVVVFQLSTPENWNQVYYDFHQGLGWGGAFYVFITVLIGHYVIESLFVVVMLSNFGTDPDEEEQPMARGSVIAPPGAAIGSVISQKPESDKENDSSRGGSNAGGPGPGSLGPSIPVVQGLMTIHDAEKPEDDQPSPAPPVIAADQDIKPAEPEHAHHPTLIPPTSSGAGSRAGSRPGSARPGSARPAHLSVDPEAGPDADVIHNPGGFFSGQSSVRVPKFVRRIGKNIAKSKARARAEREKREEEEIIALASRRNSASNSPAISRTSTRQGHRSQLGAKENDGTASLSRSRTGLLAGLADGALSALNSFKFFGKSKTFSGASGDNLLRVTPPAGSHNRSTSVALSTGPSLTPPLQRERDGLELKSEVPSIDPSPMAKDAHASDSEAGHHHQGSGQNFVGHRFSLATLQPPSSDFTAADQPIVSPTADEDRIAVPPVVLSRPSIVRSSPLLEPLRPTVILPIASLNDQPTHISILSPSDAASPPGSVRSHSMEFKERPMDSQPSLGGSPLSNMRSISPEPAFSRSSVDGDGARPLLHAQASIDPLDPALMQTEHQPLARFDSNLQTFYVPPVEATSPLLKPKQNTLAVPSIGSGELLIDTEKIQQSRRMSLTFVMPPSDAKSLLVIPHHHVTRNTLFYLVPPPAFTYTSCGIFGPESWFRNWLCDIIHNDWWNMGVFFLILFSCILLALDYPDLDPNSQRAQALTIMEYFTTALYVVEMIFRIIVFGLISHPSSYLRGGWNLMEFTIVIISLVSFGYPSLSFLKASRALRPLRILSRLPSARVIVSSLGRSMSNMTNVMVVSFLLLYMLALVGVQLFQGRLQQCLSVPSGAPILVGIEECAARGGIWENPLWTGNYDNIFSALLVMFELSTEENWPGIMVTAIDATEYGKPPVIENNQVFSIYFVVCVVLGSMFIKNLFTATILDGYSLNYAEITGAGGEATPHQELWLDFYKLIVDNKPLRSIPRPKVRWFSVWDLKFRRMVYDFCRTVYFEYVFLLVITLNVVTLAMVYTDQGQTYTDVLFVINSMCTWAFAVEIMLLWFGIGVRAYFRSGWNTFDFIVVIASIFEFFVDANYIPFSLGFNPSFFRVVRMTRIFKIFRKFPRLVQLGNTVWFALPALYNVGLLMFLLFFVYSILAMNIFGNVKYGFYLTEHGNFETFTSAMVTLFRMVTGENWNGIMRDCMVEQPFCGGSDCGNSIVAPIVFISFMIFSSMLVMDLIVAIVLNQFENELAKEKRVLDAFVQLDDILEFAEYWSEYSGGKLHLPVSKLNQFIRALPPHNRLSPMKFETDGVAVYNLIDSLEIPCDRHRVHYLDVIYQLGQRAFYLRFPEQKEEMTQRLQTAHAQQVLLAELGRHHHHRRDGELFSTSGIPLANEDLKLIREQALREFPVFKHTSRWRNQAGYVNRIVLVQKLARGFLDRKNSPISKAKMQSMVKSLKKAVLRQHMNAEGKSFNEEDEANLDDQLDELPPMNEISRKSRKKTI